MPVICSDHRAVLCGYILFPYLPVWWGVKEETIGGIERLVTSALLLLTYRIPPGQGIESRSRGTFERQPPGISHPRTALPPILSPPPPPPVSSCHPFKGLGCHHNREMSRLTDLTTHIHVSRRQVPLCSVCAKLYTWRCIPGATMTGGTTYPRHQRLVTRP